MDAFEVTGSFWLPVDPKRRVGGRFCFDPDEGIDVRIQGSHTDLREWHSVPRVAFGHLGAAPIESMEDRSPFVD